MNKLQIQFSTSFITVRKLANPFMGSVLTFCHYVLDSFQLHSHNLVVVFCPIYRGHLHIYHDQCRFGSVLFVLQRTAQIPIVFPRCRETFNIARSNFLSSVVSTCCERQHHLLQVLQQQRWMGVQISTCFAPSRVCHTVLIVGNYH